MNLLLRMNLLGIAYTMTKTYCQYKDYRYLLRIEYILPMMYCPYKDYTFLLRIEYILWMTFHQ